MSAMRPPPGLEDEVPEAPPGLARPQAPAAQPQGDGASQAPAAPRQEGAKGSPKGGGGKGGRGAQDPGSAPGGKAGQSKGKSKQDHAGAKAAADRGASRNASTKRSGAAPGYARGQADSSPTRQRGGDKARSASAARGAPKGGAGPGYKGAGGDMRGMNASQRQPMGPPNMGMGPAAWGPGGKGCAGPPMQMQMPMQGQQQQRPMMPPMFASGKGAPTWNMPPAASPWPGMMPGMPGANVPPFLSTNGGCGASHMQPTAMALTAATQSLQKFTLAEELRIASETKRAQEGEPAQPDQAEIERRRAAAERLAEANAKRISLENGDLVKDDAGLDDTRYHGKIKSYNTNSGFGFIECDELRAKHGSDVFLNQNVDGGIVIGGIVSFSIELNAQGKPQARKVCLEAKSAPEPINNTYGGLQDRIFTGRVKSFSTHRGFGFVVCPDLVAYLGGVDIYVAKAQVPEGGLIVGQEVSFALSFDAKGNPQGKNVTRLAKSAEKPISTWTSNDMKTGRQIGPVAGQVWA
eukprot:TRINITY_DN75097_c0_g1_i1.p1 TRINITY_DN75097_c0_g1~~TRINITY_DN75097_c0_g1_i1.p1  ORF type:complete len:536 (-),score=116.64 TRINITY_DN75097_c0_g1_i1:103-1665(-)